MQLPASSDPAAFVFSLVGGSGMLFVLFQEYVSCRLYRFLFAATPEVLQC